MTDANADSAEPSDGGEKQKFSGPWFAAAYAVACLAGLVPVFLSEQLWLFPLLAMGGYYYAAHIRARESEFIIEFADSFYYLGFTLSVGTLVAAIKPFSVDSIRDPEEVFHYFGLGMLTTLVGVVGRTTMQTFYRTPSESAEALNKQIAALSEEYVDNLVALRDKTVAALTLTTTAYEETLGPSFTSLRLAAADSVRHAEDMTTVIDSVRTALDQSTAVLTKAHDTTAHTLKTLSDEQQRIGTAFVRIGDSANQAAEATSKTRADLRSTVDALVAEAEKARLSMATFADSLTSVRVDPTALVAALNSLVSIAEQVGQSLGQEVKAVGATAQEYRAVTDGIRQVSGSLPVAEIQGVLTGLRESIDAVTQAVALNAKSTNENLAVSQLIVESARASAVSLNAALDEVAEAATLRLERIK